jgi:TonB family protein
MSRSERTLLISYVSAATLLLHLLIVPLWAAWLDRPAEAAAQPPLKPRCADEDKDALAPDRPCLPGKVCPRPPGAPTEAHPFRLALRDEPQLPLDPTEALAPEPEPEPPPKPPEPEPLLQTVSAPVDPSETLAEPENPRFAATTSTRTDHEQVKRGDDLGAGGGPKRPSVGQEVSAPESPRSSQPSKALPPTKTTKATKPNPKPTKPDPLDFEAALARETFPDTHPKPRPDTEDPGERPTSPAPDKAASASSSSSSRPLSPEELVRVNPELISSLLPSAQGGGGGSIDYLNGVEEGDRTLLNRKRTSYASFFERVQVAIKNNWEPASLYRRRDPTGRVYGTIDRVTILQVALNSDGTLASLTVKQPSGLDFLDEEAVRAVRAAAPFPNPPEGLKDLNGHIQFSFGFYFELSSRSSRLFRFR